MKKLYIIFILIFFIVPVCSKAESFPEFPMSFWGKVYVNNSLVSQGSKLRAYYENTLGGEVIVQGGGVYGYTEPTKQKLIIKSGEGNIMFKLESSAVNNGIEFSSDTQIIYEKFESGKSINKDLYFTFSPVVNNSGGGGGGSSSNYVSTTTTTTKAIVVPTTTTKPKGQVLGASTTSEKELSNLMIILRSLLIQLNNMGGKLPPGSEKYLVSDSLIDSSKKPSSIIRDLFLTSQGNDVKLLQEFLINQNKGQFSKQLQQAGVTGYFGMVTKQALSEYQKSIGIKPSNGYFGKITKSFLVSLGY